MLIDCFLYFNETDILDIRFHELNDIVDKFVIVESTITFSGKSKSLNFEKVKNRFKPYLNKIEYIIIDNIPPQPTSTEIEYFQRNSMLNALNNCKDNDIIMFSDLDEIPNAKDVIKYSTYDGLTTFISYLYYYYLNCKGELTDIGTQMISYGLIKKFNLKPRELRDRLTRKNILLEFPISYQKLYSGWHFSYTGGADTIIAKIEASAHVEKNLPKFKDKKYLKECMKNGQDIYQRKNVTFEFVPIDDSFPIWVRENQNQLSHMIKDL